MENEKKIKTEAELQMERLMQLKIEKEKREQERMYQKTVKPVKSFNSPFFQRQPYNVKIEKKVYEKIRKIVKGVNLNKNKKISRTKFINNVLKVFSELNIDFNSVNDIGQLKEIFKKLESNK
jgi:hypothetical protein